MTAPPAPQSDAPLLAVVAALRKLDPTGERMGKVIRETLDQLYNGGKTGHYRWSELSKTEKTHGGTIVEINLQRELGFADGTKLDYTIVGEQVDAKYSQDMWKWMIPPEAFGELCLVLHAVDEESQFSAGVVRAREEWLTGKKDDGERGGNRDKKVNLAAEHRPNIVWLFEKAPMPGNILLQLPEADVAAIFAARKGQQRVNELFRRAVGRLVGRAAVETAAQQLDPLKRVRVNGGARGHLVPEGIVILGGVYQWQRDAARQLGLPVPGPDQFVSGYVANAGPDWAGATALGRTGVAIRPADRETATPVPQGWYGTKPAIEDEDEGVEEEDAEA